VQPDAAAHGAEHWDTLAPWSKYSSDVVLVVHHILTEPAVPTATVRFELPERAGSGVLGHCAADTVEEAVMGAIDAAQAKLRALIDNAGKEVMPDAAQSPPAGHDIGPGDQAVAGAAPRRASGPIDSDAGFATSGAEARWIADIDAGVYDDAQPEPWPSAAIREAALREAADSLLECSVWCDGQERTDDGWRNGVADARKHHTARILALIDNPRKEVMPPVPVIDATNASDIGPGDQAVAGAAAYPALREAIHKMVGLYETGDRSTYSACPQSAILAIAFLDDYEARNRPAPKLLVDDCDIALTWEVGGWKLYQYCDAEESISFRWIGTPIAARPEPVAGAAPRRASGPIDSDAGFATSGAEARWIADIDAGVYDDAQPAPWPENLFGLTGDTLHLRCATEGCGRRVSTRFAGSDYCEPCGRKVALAQKGDSHER
jgi:hypothetical protein